MQVSGKGSLDCLDKGVKERMNYNAEAMGYG